MADPSVPPGPLVSGEWLSSNLRMPELCVVDVRWVLGQPGAGRARFATGHIPGAVHLDIETELSDLTRPGRGRHPLPPKRALASRFGAHGLHEDTVVVAYDDAGGTHAARLWWLLEWLGHRSAKVLDGGLQAYLDAGGTLTTQAPALPPGHLEVREARVRALTVDEVVARLDAQDAILLDARAFERFEGRVEPIDPRPGHIPGARSAPFAANLDERGRFRAAAELRSIYEARLRGEPQDVIVYCGSGVTACHDVLAMTVAGLPTPLLFEGSWSAWAARPELPAAIGPAPGEWPRERGA